MAIQAEREEREKQRFRERAESIRDELGQENKTIEISYYKEVPIAGVITDIKVAELKDEKGNKSYKVYSGKREIGQGSKDGKELEIYPEYIQEIQKLIEEKGIAILHPELEYKISREELESKKDYTLSELEQERTKEKSEDIKDTKENEKGKDEEKIKESGNQLGLDMDHKVDITGFGEGLNAVGLKGESSYDKIFLAYSKENRRIFCLVC